MDYRTEKGCGFEKPSLRRSEQGSNCPIQRVRYSVVSAASPRATDADGLPAKERELTPKRTSGPVQYVEPWSGTKPSEKTAQDGPTSPARALRLALLQTLHVRVFRQLRFGRAERQSGFAVAVEEEIKLGVAIVATYVAD